MSDFNVSASFSDSAIFVFRIWISSSVRTLMASFSSAVALFFSRSATHISWCAISSAFCFFRASTMESIASWTFVNESSLLCRPRVMRTCNPNFRPCCTKYWAAAAARPAVEWVDSSWRKDTVLPNRSRVSSVRRTCRVLETASISAALVLMRSWYFSSLPAQRLATVSLSFTSSPKESVVALMSFFAASRDVSDSAFSSVFARICSSRTLLSVALAAIRDS
mmetsp:Transcript_136533/g.323369  ORF Transcript_136533/g.323369 Transcript_136533/m.323369 type:complete len:222 (+) Transcript_136533:669-1334(+)